MIANLLAIAATLQGSIPTCTCKTSPRPPILTYILSSLLPSFPLYYLLPMILSTHPLISPSMFSLSAYLWLPVCVYLSIYLSVCLSIHPSIYISVLLSIILSFISSFLSLPLYFLAFFLLSPRRTDEFNRHLKHKKDWNGCTPCCSTQNYHRSLKPSTLRNRNAELKTTERLSNRISRKSMERFMKYMENYIYGFMQTRLYYGSIWPKTEIALQLLLKV
jgi:hypothetical protein